MSKILTLSFLLIVAGCGGGDDHSQQPLLVEANASNVSGQLQPTILASVEPAQSQPPLPTGVNACDVNTLGEAVKTVLIPSRGMNYPAVVRSIADPSTVLMFSGNFAHQADQAMLASTPAGDESHIRFPFAQEELWVAAMDESRTSWATDRRFVIGLRPETPVQRLGGASYDAIFPKGFEKSCYDTFQDRQCNVQINDASAITYEINGEPHYFVYFTLFENFRWHSPELGELHAEGPSNPATQNIQAIGLATSRDGYTWEFVDKVLGESEVDSDMEEILGAWSPSAIVDPHTGKVDVYFHDALGTKQYVAHFSDGINLIEIERFNKSDNKYRANLDVLFRNGRYEVMYNDNDYAIASTSFTNLDEFGVECGEKIIIPADSTEVFPTPHQFLNDDGRLHLYYWDFHNDENIIVKLFR